MNKPLNQKPVASPLSRRTVFVGAGTVGALAAAAALLPKTAAPLPASATAALPTAPDGGYQVTEHVLRYYQTARV